MELEKVTSEVSPEPPTLLCCFFVDACGMALALELVGERWVPLILRELMFGPRHAARIVIEAAGQGRRLWRNLASYFF